MKRCIIIGGGNSVREGIEKGLWDKIHNETTWSINYAFMVMPYLPTREVWVDLTFWKKNIEHLEKLHNQGVQLVSRKHTQYENRPEIIKYPATREAKNFAGKGGIVKNLLFYGQMGLSGCFALSLAIAEGYDDICLLGFDFGNASVKDANTHFYQGQINVWSTGVGHPTVYRQQDDSLKRSVKDWEIFTKENTNIYNVSLNSNIPYFPKLSWEQFYEHIST